MTPAGPQRAVRVQDIPTLITELDVLGSDYVDLFAAPAGDAVDAPAEAWARAAVEGAPAAGRFLAWRLLCHLRLDPTPSPDRIGGWTVTGRGDRWIRVEARSWAMTANMVFRLDAGTVYFATLVRYDRRAAAAVWGAVSAVHRQVAPDFLRGAAKRMNAS